MCVTGHKTRSVFDRYNIVSEGDMREAARKMQTEAEKKPFVTQLGHDSVTVALPAQVRVVNWCTVFNSLPASPDGETGRRTGLKIPGP